MFTTESQYKKQAKEAGIRFYLFTVIVFIVIILFVHFLDRRSEYLRYQESSIKTIHFASIEISNYFFEVIEDLSLLARHKHLFSGSRKAREELSRHFIQYAHIQRNYHQIRFINLKGEEIVRVNFDGNKAQKVPFSKLQNKFQRKYFQDVVNLKKGEVYISRLDFNIDRGKIEKPIRPVIRLAMPVFDKSGKKSGILMINYMGENLLEKIGLIDQDSKVKLMLLNHEGYWLYLENKSDSWGVQLSGAGNIKEDFPQEWKKILQKSKGQIISNNGLFNFSSTGVQMENYRIGNEKYLSDGLIDIILEEKPWKIVALVDADTLASGPISRSKYMLLSLLVAMIGLIPVSVIWGKRKSQSIVDKKKIETFTKIIEQSDELIYITDVNSKIIFANQAFERNTGYTVDEAIGQTPALIRSGMHPNEFYKQLYKTINAGKEYHAVVINRKKDGTIFYETKTISSLKDINGNIEYFVSLGWDISETHTSKEHELEIITRMSGAISHHFNNILNVIINYVSLAIKNLDENSHEKTIRYLHNVHNSALKAEDLVEKIFYSGHQRLNNLSKISIDSMILDSIKKIRENLPEDIKFKLQIEKGLPNIKAKVDLIDYALRALIKNSEEAIDKNGEIEIGVSVSTHVNKTCVTCDSPINGKYLDIFVRDNGSGIDSSVKGHVFDPFFSDKEEAKSVVKTPGLGLTSVRGIVHAHGGHMLLESIENIGTSICLLLPMDD